MPVVTTRRLTRVKHIPPKPGTTHFADVVEIDLPSEPRVLLEPGTCYRAAKPGEAPTHYPDVPNGYGALGFVVDGPTS